jgi:demethylmenaquinone methyltransferase / 2-methoxy-6-polyprenyl-1,4-benzoquinol methylase
MASAKPASIPAEGGPSTQESWRMFDRIAGRYDLLNRLLSGGTDVAWRRRMARHLPDRPNLNLLDMATGTGDVMLMMEGLSPNLERGVGMDMSAGMLAIGRDKIAARGLQKRFSMVRSDAVAIAAPDNTYDAATIAFGIRNVPDVPKGLSEMHRVLTPGGRALVLEFSLPANAAFRQLYLFYFRNVLPRIGGLISGDSYAYRYLNQTVETFPYGEAFCDLMRDAGFRDVKAFPLTFGIATLYQGDK